MLPHVIATRYVTPLREGGSLPGVMEADEPGFADPEAVRAAYLDWFVARVAARDAWLGPVADAVAAGPTRRPHTGTRPRWLR